jgi:hypothetical protein
MVNIIKRILNCRVIASNHQNGSLTVVALVFISMMLACLIFQCVSYQRNISTIESMTQTYRQRQRKLLSRQKESVPVQQFTIANH